MTIESKAAGLLAKIRADAEAGGYTVNPDEGFALSLAEGLMTNEERYGYQACPCRLASGIADEDRGIVCPCDYRDADLVEFGACYCALFVSREIAKGERKLTSIQDRRHPERPDTVKAGAVSNRLEVNNLPYPVWRCRVCGYLCARENPPGICPICKARSDRFERFL